MRLKDKIALITGGATGIGRAIALLFVREGARVAISGRRKSRLEQTLAELGELGGEVMAVAGDVSRRLDAERMVTEVIERWGTIDIVVNNAGSLDRTGVTDCDIDRWDNVIATNLGGVFLTSRVAIPQMIAQGGGCIINIASIAGRRGAGGNASYSAAKAAVINLTKAMAVDYGPNNIRVNAVSPGLVRTEMSQTRLRNGEDWDERATREWIPGYPLGRLGTPEDIAKGVLFLASDDAAWITGEDLVIDGGYTARL